MQRSYGLASPMKTPEWSHLMVGELRLAWHPHIWKSRESTKAIKSITEEVTDPTACSPLSPYSSLQQGNTSVGWQHELNETTQPRTTGQSLLYSGLLNIVKAHQVQSRPVPFGREQSAHNHTAWLPKGLQLCTQLLLTHGSLIILFCKILQSDRAIPDFSRVFDTVPLKGLISKLTFYGAHGQVLTRIDLFLSDHKMAVGVDDNTAKECIRVLSEDQRVL